MAPVELTTESFADAVEGGGIVLVDFWAGWCAPCLRFAPIFDAAAEEHPDITFAKVNVDLEPDLAGGLEVMAIPTLMAFRDGYLVFREAGMMSRAALGTLIDQVESLDMEKLKAESQLAD